MNILIVEDDFLSRKLLHAHLEGLGYDVTVAKDGEEAWRLYQSMTFRLVVSDWLMPGVDGLSLCERIRAQGEPYTYFILLTANVAEETNYDEAMQRGVDDFLAKPLDKRELVMRLRVAERIIQSMSRIKSLESVLTICAYTKKIKFPDEGWQTIEEFMDRHLGLRLSHGIEPQYYETHIKPQLEQMKRQAKEG